MLRNPLASPDIIGRQHRRQRRRGLRHRDARPARAWGRGRRRPGRPADRRAGALAGRAAAAAPGWCWSGVGRQRRAVLGRAATSSPAPTSGTCSSCCSGSPAASTGPTGPRSGLLAVLLLVLLPVVVWLARSARAAELGRGHRGRARGHRPAHRARCCSWPSCWSRWAWPRPGRSPSSPSSPDRSPGPSTAAARTLVGRRPRRRGDRGRRRLPRGVPVPDVNYPVGVVTGAFGAPFLLWLLATGRTSRRS